MRTTGTDDISRAARRGVSALKDAAYTGGGEFSASALPYAMGLSSR